MDPQPADAWTLLIAGAAAGIAGAWALRAVVRAVRRAIAPALADDRSTAGSSGAGGRSEDLERRNAQLEREREREKERRRVLSDMNEMLLLQKEEMEERARELAEANSELERMGQLTAWQQEALAERNEALERQTAEAERLSRELSRRVGQLNDALAQIERMNRDHEAFLRHELRNAISPILGYVELARSESGPGTGAEGWLDRIRESAEAVEALLSQMKNLQAIERGTRPVAREPVAMDALVRSAVRSVDPSSAMAIEVTAEPCSVDGDPGLLPGVIINLLRNAVEHVGGSNDPRVSVEVATEGDHVVMRVQNGGPPIPPERVARFFDRFNSTKPGGSGLGTSYVDLVVRAHGGDATVSSTPESGTTVTIRLPASASRRS